MTIPRTVFGVSTKDLALVLLVACITLLFQGMRFLFVDVADFQLWGNQAQWVYQGDPEAYNFLAGYAHPGGPLIELGIVLHTLFKVPYNYVAVLGVSMLNTLAILLILGITYRLRKNAYLLVVVWVFTAFNWLYLFVTPPTASASVYAVLLVLATLCIAQEKTVALSWREVLWGVAAGMLVSLRTDVGALFALGLYLYLLGLRSLRFDALVALPLVALCTFLITDPFFWILPVQHVYDLVFKVSYHYNTIEPYHIEFIRLLSMSWIAWCAVVFAVFMAWKRELRMPPGFLAALLGIAVVMHGILLSAHYQAERYFVPVIMVGEVIGAFVVFDVLQKHEGRYRGVFELSAFQITCALVLLYEGILFVYDEVRFLL